MRRLVGQEHIDDYLDSEFSSVAECFNCRESDRIVTTPRGKSASQVFYEDGWREIGRAMICPRCIEGVIDE